MSLRAARERKSKVKARNHVLQESTKEISTLMKTHWRVFTEDAPAFFHQIYHDSYLKRPGPRRPNEKGTRGVFIVTWKSIDEMRIMHSPPPPPSSSSSSSSSLLTSSSTKPKKKSNKRNRLVFPCSYVCHHNLTTDSNDDLRYALQKYDPETSFIVALWCAKPPVCEFKIIHRDAHRELLLQPRRSEVFLVQDSSRSTTDSKDIIGAVKCFQPECNITETTDRKLLPCARCRTVTYCSKTCQRLDWQRHKPVCMCYIPEIKPTSLLHLDSSLTSSLIPPSSPSSSIKTSIVQDDGID